MDLGVCLNDKEFEPFIDEIIENGDFSVCYDLYLKKQFNGDKEPCDQYEEPEEIEIPEGMDLETYLHIENLKHQNMDEIIKYFYNSDSNIVINAISFIPKYVYIGSEDAYEGLLNYYMSLGPAESLDDVYTRMKIVELLAARSEKESGKDTIEAYVNELARTPSNNMTRQLYSLILKRLQRCPGEAVRELILELLNKRQYSYKIKKRIMGIIED